MKKKTILSLTASGLVALSSLSVSYLPAFAADQNQNQQVEVSKGHGTIATTTPIKHVVVIFGENISFDHYFGTYPTALNLQEENKFTAKPNTPAVNGLQANKLNGHQDLLNHNPNSAQPKRLAPSQALTADMDHNYTEEQKAFNGGKMDKFVENTGLGTDKTVVMDYFDGNTVTGLWNYAQNFALSDNSFNTTFGSSTPGAINLISGQTHGAIGYSANRSDATSQKLQSDADGFIISNLLNTNGTIYGDTDPYFDTASKGKTVEMTGKNVGDLLNAKNVTWGWFQGGFRDTTAQHANIGGKMITDYVPHREPFQFYKSTANPNHLPPSSTAMIGKTDQANHQYDMTDFWDAAESGNMPAVSFLKAGDYQSGHAGTSDPIDEQQFIIATLNRIQKLLEWKDTAVFLAYDDSDGWYDHQYHAPVNGSNDPKTDALFGAGDAGKPVLGDYLDRAGYGPRLPLMVVSPYAKSNFVDHTLTDQTSILRFIEDNWKLGRIGDHSFDEMAGSLNNMFDFNHGPRNNRLFLDPKTGQPAKANGEDNSKK